MRMLADLGGKVAVITGGGSGIGAALARACAHEGMRVVVVDIDESRIEAVGESLDAATTGVLPFVADVADPSSVDRLAEVVYDTFGSTDLLCNNAGVSPLGCLWEFSPADWEWIIGVNILGVANCVRSFIPRMIAQGSGGHVVNTASEEAFRPAARNGAYGATKHAVLGLSDVLRIDLASFGIGVSVLCPGPVNTNIADSLARPSARHDTAALAADVAALTADLGETANAWIEPERVAELVLWGVRENKPYIVTSPGQRRFVAERCETILKAHDDASKHDPTLP
jgi:NAD(P)-dependent dehydrogenase (short-subunit alcohol dehydrogenase family)